MELTDEQIKSIAEDLDCGMKVYVNKETREIKTIIDFDSHYDVDSELWKEDINEIDENYDNYLEFEKMDSSEAFQVMEEFTQTVEDGDLRRELELGLQLSKPFRNFKDIIDSGGKYRDKWFEFKLTKNIEYVKEQLRNYNREQS